MRVFVEGYCRGAAGGHRRGSSWLPRIDGHLCPVDGGQVIDRWLIGSLSLTALSVSRGPEAAGAAAAAQEPAAAAGAAGSAASIPRAPPG